ncbi:cutinase family protein, partial [Nocardia otitidiscaviarum]|uniref:cutinase family protein n=1 Tax=Nocardia otitidiscaviarum TaxID=1823 RepID=UPI000694610E
MTIDVLWLAGTGFGRSPDDISLTFAKHLDANRFRFLPVRYPADYGAAVSYADSRADGRQALIDAIRATPNLVVLGGYSQGAGIAGDLAAEIGRGQHPDLEVVGCALIADPARPPRSGMPHRPPASGYGITGARDVLGVPTWWAAAEGDPICSLPAGNPLRTLADVTEYYSLADAADAWRWMQSLLARAEQGRWQRWWSLRHWRTWGGAVAYARGYL